jgi:hypothetical protein
VRWILFVMVAACGESSAPPDAIGCRTDPVSFEHDVQPLIGHCGGEMCHAGIGTSWQYTSLVGVETMQCDDHRLMVAPGDPAASYLMQKLEGRQMCMGVGMPKMLPPLPPAELQTIASWICQGALNN